VIRDFWFVIVGKIMVSEIQILINQKDTQKTPNGSSCMTKKGKLKSKIRINLKKQSQFLGGRMDVSHMQQ